MEFVYDVPSQMIEMDVDGKESELIKTLQTNQVKLHYRSDFVDFGDPQHPKKIYLKNTKDDELIEKSIYVMSGTFMQYKKNQLIISFGGLIGEFAVNYDKIDKLDENDLPNNKKLLEGGLWFLCVLCVV